MFQKGKYYFIITNIHQEGSIIITLDVMIMMIITSQLLIEFILYLFFSLHLSI